MAAKKSTRSARRSKVSESPADPLAEAGAQLREAASSFTVQDVAKKCDVHPETVKRWIGSGKLRAFKLGGHWRIRPEHVTAYLRAQGAA